MARIDDYKESFRLASVELKKGTPPRWPRLPEPCSHLRKV